MTLTHEEPGIYGREVLDLTLIDIDDAIDQIRMTDQRRRNPNAGIAWFVQFGAEASEGLVLGIRGEVGALQWFTPTELLKPANGRNQDDVDYFTGPTGDHCPMSSELPSAEVLGVLREFASTRSKPTGLEWVPEA
ncbi:Imm1 family immunity protein [Saccharopolyspora phatthalungensis]|uniref:Immunity protein Imm1 n=1 Tax=Saccharopolyspora phatthalungensis TaxID=664693 RepID=A0A840Q195_9PSEU|nr:Imm1 family immunity protein [Saccharopolyspora phatthalungensis]MBB5152568.1 hypothetical protein [Saccharopolyspora phatthalungensis]